MKYLILFLIAFGAYANDFEEIPKIPYSVIGRGFYNQDLRVTLQLACVGDYTAPVQPGDQLTTANLERSCDQLQFLVTNEEREQVLIGPIFFLSDNAEQKIVKQLKAKFQENGLGRKLTRQHKFSATRFFYGSGKHISFLPELSLIAAAAGVAKLTLVLESAGHATMLAHVGMALGTMLSTPIVFDIVTLPVTAIWDAIEGNKAWGFRVKSIKVLQDSAKYSWQFKSKKMGDRKFNHIIERMVANCGFGSYIYPGSLVVLPRTNRYNLNGRYGIVEGYSGMHKWRVKPLLKEDRENNTPLWPTFTESELNAMRPTCEK